MLVVVLDQNLFRPAQTAPNPPGPFADPSEDQHPPAPHPEVSPVLDQGVEDVDAQDDQGGPHHTLQNRVDSGREVLPQGDGTDSEDEHDQSVSEGIEGGEEHRRPGRVLGTGDVGDRRDVVPVDAVPEPESEHGGDEADPEALSCRDGDHPVHPSRLEARAGGGPWIPHLPRSFEAVSPTR